MSVATNDNSDSAARPDARLLQHMSSLADGMQRFDTEIRSVLDAVYPDLEDREETEELENAADDSKPGEGVTPPVNGKRPSKADKWAAASKHGHLAAFIEYIANPKTKKQVIFQDKLSFALGLCNVMFTSFLVAYPRLFVLWFAFKAVVLLTSRWLTYRIKGAHYYLLEFCYVAIGLGVLSTTLFPQNAFVHKLVFALMAGVLTPATIATRNSFVLHSIDKMTSLFQHLTPTIVAWLMRWHTRHVVPGFDQLSELQQQDFASAGFATLTLAPLAVWAAWAAAYYVWVFVVNDKKVSERGYATMFQLQTKNKDSAYAKFILGRPTKHQRYAMYMASHGAMCVLGMLLNNLTFHSCILHSIYVLSVLAVSVWNGANYYILVFAKRYHAGLEAMDDAPKNSKSE